MDGVDLPLWTLPILLLGIVMDFLGSLAPVALVTNGLIAIWVLLDGRERKARGAIMWAVGTMLLAPLVAAVYVAKRPLRAAETREGGTAWNIVKNFIIFWTVLMAAAAVWAVSVRSLAALGNFALIWLVPAVFALVFGPFLKKSVIEKGQ